MFYKLGEQCIYWLWVLVQLACCPSQWLDVHVRYHVSDESLQLIMTLSSRPPSAFFPRSASSVLTQPPDGAVISGHPTTAKQNTRPARLHTRADEHSGEGGGKGHRAVSPCRKTAPGPQKLHSADTSNICDHHHDLSCNNDHSNSLSQQIVEWPSQFTVVKQLKVIHCRHLVRLHQPWLNLTWG